jgi:hypothetical protein
LADRRDRVRGLLAIPATTASAAQASPGSAPSINAACIYVTGNPETNSNVTGRSTERSIVTGRGTIQVRSGTFGGVRYGWGRVLNGTRRTRSS